MSRALEPTCYHACVSVASSVSLPTAERVLVVTPHAALASAPTAGVALFERCPPVHSVVLGSCRLATLGRRIESTTALALPANTPHALLELSSPFACVAYLDARRYRFADVQRLAEVWRGFVPGQDDLREAMGDALRAPKRRLDGRVLRAVAALEGKALSIAEVAAGVGLSDSRLTHLVTETLGAPPRDIRAWFMLRRALHEALFTPASLTAAAHRAGFADSAHLTRTCKRLTGARPGMMLPQAVYTFPEG